MSGWFSNVFFCTGFFFLFLSSSLLPTPRTMGHLDCRILRELGHFSNCCGFRSNLSVPGRIFHLAFQFYTEPPGIVYIKNGKETEIHAFGNPHMAMKK